MIEDGQLVHAQIDSSLKAWQPESFFITGLILAVLATVLSFQSTSLAYDLFLGNKPSGEVTAPNMHMLLLADEGSPLSVAAALFRQDEFDRARFYGDIPKTTTIVRNRARIRRAISVKLFFMLLTAPLINLIAVFLALEYDEDVSFAEAGFGGVGFGFAKFKNASVQRERFGAKCSRLASSFSHAADEHAQFFYCLDTATQRPLDAPPANSRLTLRALPTGQLELTFELAGISKAFRQSASFDVFTGEEVYRIAQVFTQDDLQELVEEIGRYWDECRVEIQEINTPEPTASRLSEVVRQDVPTATQTFSCPVLASGIALNSGAAGGAAGFTLEEGKIVNFTLVETDKFRVVNIRDLPVDGSAPPWFDGRNLTLLKRRQNFVPVGILSIVVAVLLIVRVFAECITNNDVYDGIDEVVARNVGLPNSYALIRSDRLMRYDHKYQSGLAGHYGTPRQGLTEVRDFSGGSVGFGGPEDPFASQDPGKYYGEEVNNPNLND